MGQDHDVSLVAADLMLLSYRHGISLLVILTLCILIMMFYKDLNVMSHFQRESVTTVTTRNSTVMFERNDTDSQLVHPNLPPQSLCTPNSSSISVSAEQETQLLPDGCGIEDGVEPQWVQQTPDDLVLLADVKRCKQRLVEIVTSGDNEDVAWRDGVNVTYLKCRTIASLQVLSKYRTIYMIGDSLMRQQFMVLNCMLNLSADINVTDTPAKVEYRSIVSHADGTTTNIVYTPFGCFFPPPSQTQPLYQNEYPAALANGTEHDMIIINAGHHYYSEMASTLENDASYIAEKARGRPTHVYFMETTDEQWPTSNGMYPTFGDECCCAKCSCEVLNADRIQGRARLDTVNHNFSKAFGRLSPDQATLDPVFDPNQKLNHSACVPDCYPANWRNVLVREILQKQPNVHVVPTWRQLVARNLLNSFMMTDCTHQSVDTLIEVNRQLLRTIIDIRTSTKEDT